jgi:uncharacterized radical SAM superfamily Fe-S cluster-containing enzyme
VVQISGGEPTIHPQFFDILDAARRRPIRHLMVNTNGIRIAEDEAVREGIFKLFATNHSPQSGMSTLRDLLCCLPHVEAPAGLGYQNLFRVIIMQFIDAHAFDVRSVKKTCVHIVHPDGRLIPFDTYNLFYRDDLESTRLTSLRAGR